MLRQQRTSVCLRWVLTLSVLVISGCNNNVPAPTPTAEAVAIAATPVIAINLNPNITEISAGDQVAISVEATGSNLQFKWQAAKGNLSGTEGQSVIYTAPDELGLATVDITVTSDGGSTTRTVTFTIIKPTAVPTSSPTSTSTQIPTDTPALAPTDTPTTIPTDTPSPVPTDTPAPTPTNTLIPDTPTPVAGLVTLTNFQNGQRDVPCENVAEGTYSSDVTDPIWAIVFIGSFHPQDPTTKIDEKWFGTVRFGSCNVPDSDPASGKGKVFQLFIVTANEQCNQKILDYLDEAAQKKSFPGLPAIPEGCKVHSRIAITRD